MESVPIEKVGGSIWTERAVVWMTLLVSAPALVAPVPYLCSMSGIPLPAWEALALVWFISALLTLPSLVGAAVVGVIVMCTRRHSVRTKIVVAAIPTVAWVLQAWTYNAVR